MENGHCSITVFSYPLLPRKVVESDLPHRRHLSLRPVTRRTPRAAQEATISPETEVSVKGSWPFPRYISFVRAACALEEKLADFAQTQMQLMEVTVRLTVSDETAGC